jgi:hypothetical protein
MILSPGEASASGAVVDSASMDVLRSQSQALRHVSEPLVPAPQEAVRQSRQCRQVSVNISNPRAGIDEGQYLLRLGHYGLGQ